MVRDDFKLCVCVAVRLCVAVQCIADHLGGEVGERWLIVAAGWGRVCAHAVCWVGWKFAGAATILFYLGRGRCRPSVSSTVALGSANKTVIAPVRLIWALAAIAGGLPASCLPSIVITNDTETSRPAPFNPLPIFPIRF